jgi:hypothetical protein
MFRMYDGLSPSGRRDVKILAVTLPHADVPISGGDPSPLIDPSHDIADGC